MENIGIIPYLIVCVHKSLGLQKLLKNILDISKIVYEYKFKRSTNSRSGGTMLILKLKKKDR
jgi:hypothetical protein